MVEVELGNLAEWASAVGGLAAVTAAIALARSASRSEQRRVEARGRVAAFRLAPVTVTILGDIRRAKKCIAEMLKQDIAMPSSATLIAAGGVGIRPSIPPDIFQESWTLPPRISLAVAQLDHLLSSHDRLLENLASAFYTADSLDHRKALLGGVDTSLDAVARIATDIKTYCAKVSDQTALESRALLKVD